MPPRFTPQFDEDTEAELEQATRDIAVVISHLGFYTKDDQRIELDMPVPLPVARHWAERGMRMHPDKAVIKPAKSEQGEDIWVPVTDEDPNTQITDLGDVDPGQLAELKGLVDVLQQRIAQAEALLNSEGGAQ